MECATNGPPQGGSPRDRLITCLWWLIFINGVATGTAIGLVLALWLVVPVPPGLVLIVACWLAGNAAGWALATRADAALARRIERHPKRIRVVPLCSADAGGAGPRFLHAWMHPPPRPACP
jgi:uncharacterized protein (DUF58 family)